MRLPVWMAGYGPKALRSAGEVGDDLPHQRDQLRWFGGMVGNHVAELVAGYGRQVIPRPAAAAS